MKAGVLSFVAMILCGFVATAHARLIACVGDSITYGSGISDRLNDSYPAQLQRMLRQYDPAWEVQNFGVSGATLLSRGDKPYIRESAYSGAKACNPDIVIIKLGTNAATGAIMTRLTDGSRITTPLVSSMIVTDGAWHCVRLVWDGSHRYLHVDDAEVASDKRTLNALRSCDAGFCLGAGKDLESGSFWSGLIDDIRVYNRAVKP